MRALFTFLLFVGCGDATMGEVGNDAARPTGDGGTTLPDANGATAIDAGNPEPDAGDREPPPVFLADWCEGDDTVLSRHASELGRRTWVQLPDSASLDGLEMGYSLLYWNDSGVWDPIRRQVHWVGGPGSCCADPAEYKRISYDVATDTWSIADTPYAGSGHAYDGNALDPNTGDHYFGLFNDSEVKRFDGSGWSNLPPLPFDGGTTPSLAWLQELDGGAGGLVYVGGYGNIAWFDGLSWSRLDDSEPSWGSYNTFAEGNEQRGVVWLGAGNGSERVHYRLNADGALTQLAEAPFSINHSQAMHGYEPVSGNYLVRNENDGSYWEFDVIADTWTPIDDMANTPDLGSGSHFQVPIPDCGVSLYFNHYWDERDVYLYRH